MHGPPTGPRDAVAGDGAQTPAQGVTTAKPSHDGGEGSDSCKDGSRARTRPRYTLHLETMGTLADRLAALITEMEESDRRLAALVTDTRELIKRTEAELAEERPQ